MIIDRLRQAIRGKFTEGKNKLAREGVENNLESYEHAILDELTNACLWQAVYPVVGRMNNKIDRNIANNDREALLMGIREDEGILNRLAEKGKRFDEALRMIDDANANDRRTYSVFNEPETDDMILISAAVDAKNRQTGQAPLPAVIVYHTPTNDTEVYGTIDMLRDTGRYPRGTDFRLLVDSWIYNGRTGMEDSAAMREEVYARLESEQARVAHAYEVKNEKYKTLPEEQVDSPRTKAFNLASSMSFTSNEGFAVQVNRFTDCIHIASVGKRLPRLSLWYNEEGISSAYYTDDFGQTRKVYDVMEFARSDDVGFLKIGNGDAYEQAYEHLLTSPILEQLFALEGMKVERSPRRVNTTYYEIAGFQHKSNELGLVEPENHGDYYKRLPVFAQESLGKRLMERYQQICGQLRGVKENVMDANPDKNSVVLADVIVDFNRVNNSISFELNGDKVWFLYNESLSDFQVVTRGQMQSKYVIDEEKRRRMPNPNFRLQATDVKSYSYVSDGGISDRVRSTMPKFWDALEQTLLPNTRAKHQFDVLRSQQPLAEQKAPQPAAAAPSEKKTVRPVLKRTPTQIIPKQTQHEEER